MASTGLLHEIFQTVERLVPMVLAETEKRIWHNFTTSKNLPMIRETIALTLADPVQSATQALTYEHIQHFRTDFYDHSSWLKGYRQTLESEKSQFIIGKLEAMRHLEAKSEAEETQVNEALQSFVTSSILEYQMRQPADADIGWSVVHKFLQTRFGVMPASTASNEKNITNGECLSFFAWSSGSSTDVVLCGIYSLQDIVAAQAAPLIRQYHEASMGN